MPQVLGRPRCSTPPPPVSTFGSHTCSLSGIGTTTESSRPVLLPLLFHIAPHEGASHPALAVRVPVAARCMSFLLGRGSEGTQAERQREAFGELERHQGSEE